MATMETFHKYSLTNLYSTEDAEYTSKSLAFTNAKDHNSQVRTISP
jgi:hypothetical protein